jgi:hypothetical protein
MRHLMIMKKIISNYTIKIILYIIKIYKYILLTTMCFRDICLRSLTKKDKIIRAYNIKIEDLFKDFHNNYILNKENEIILHNQKKNKLFLLNVIL